jgi:CRP-like cAMP-binding protein
MEERNSEWHGIEVVAFKKDDVLFKEGDFSFFFFVIRDGQVEVFRKDEEGNQKVLGVVDSGQALGEFALITNSMRSASARALTDGHAYKVSQETYQKLLADLPEWAMAVMTGLIQRLQSANDALAQQSKDDPTQTGFITEVTDKIKL